MSDDGDRPREPELAWRQLAEGLLYTHARLSENTKATLEASSFLYGLIELLQERSLVSIEELDRRQREVAQRLTKKQAEKRVGVLLQEPEYDKYTFTGGVKIDCENRVHLCRASCCRLPFALSKQDVQEGAVHWDLGQPYLIAQDEAGYCTHLDRGCHRCTVHERRPVPCRGYDCRQDRRIWLDFEGKVINPDILTDDWPRSLSTGEAGGPSA